MNSQFSVFIPIVLVWIFIFLPFIIGALSGWHALSRRYRLQDDFHGQTWSMQSALMRYAMSYNNCLTVGASQEGLYIAMPIFFVRVGHPPLLIPWQEVSATKLSGGLMGERVRLQLGQDLQIPFTIRAVTAERLKAAAGEQWPKESRN